LKLPDLKPTISFRPEELNLAAVTESGAESSEKENTASEIGLIMSYDECDVCVAGIPPFSGDQTVMAQSVATVTMVLKTQLNKQATTGALQVHVFKLGIVCANNQDLMEIASATKTLHLSSSIDTARMVSLREPSISSPILWRTL
jgi:hypothetical protein